MSYGSAPYRDAYSNFHGAQPGQYAPYAQTSAFGRGYDEHNDPFADPVSKKFRKSTSPMPVASCFLVPWLLFVAISATQSVIIRNERPGLASTVTIFGAAFVALTGFWAYSAWRKGADTRWSWFLFVASAVALFLGHELGAYNYTYNLRPYYDVSSMNTYPSVDPQTTTGQQMMDGGRFVFTADTRVDVSRSVGFKNLETYCVAPLVSGNGSMSGYDFWAVGLNCCSGHVSDFHCGEFSNPLAHSGLRLMRDDLRSFFRLAVQQAEASFNIKASHPIFVYFMQDPITEINAYQDDGYKFFLFAAFAFFAWQLLCTAVSLWLLI